MGCDIHAVFQAKRNDKWADVPSPKWDQDRHYFLFAWLANVRNGYGFAGVPTHTAITPISEPRGYPPDFDVDDDEHPTTMEAIDPKRRGWMEDDEKRRPTAWMGDHSHSWLTADEILAAPRPSNVLKTGVVTLALFKAWDGQSEPAEWCGDIWGGKSVISEPSEITPTTTHVRIEWFAPTDALDYFVNEIKALKDEHGEVRMVFGFDS